MQLSLDSEGLRKRHYINLTNGIEFIPQMNGIDFHFVRIQSSLCEQKRWDTIIQELDSDFLMYLALGYECIVYDMGNNKNVSRALYQGLPFINFCISKSWFGLVLTSYVKGVDMTEYFNQMHKMIDPRTRTKIDYFKKFVNTDRTHLRFVSVSTNKDADMEFYRNIVLNM